MTAVWLAKQSTVPSLKCSTVPKSSIATATPPPPPTPFAAPRPTKTKASRSILPSVLTLGILAAKRFKGNGGAHSRDNGNDVSGGTKAQPREFADHYVVMDVDNHESIEDVSKNIWDSFW